MKNIFKARHFHEVIILHCLRLHFTYGISYRKLEEMMQERGVSINHTTIYRWSKEYNQKTKNEFNWCPPHSGLSWGIEETRIKIRGRWKFLYRAVDEQGDTIDFYLSPVRDVRTIKKVLMRPIQLAQNHVTRASKSD